MGDESDRFETLDDDTELLSARTIYSSVFAHLSLSDAIEMSGEGTSELDISRAGFTYGETGLQSILALLRAVDLSSFCCKCGGAAAMHKHKRCGICGRRRDGANIVDYGSGVGNVVIGAALLVAAGLVRASSVRGVELLPTLHRAASATVDDLLQRFRTTHTTGEQLLRAPLPVVEVFCADLASSPYLADADVCYLCSTAFPRELVERWSIGAAAHLLPAHGSHRRPL